MHIHLHLHNWLEILPGFYHTSKILQGCVVNHVNLLEGWAAGLDRRQHVSPAAWTMPIKLPFQTGSWEIRRPL